MVWLRRLIWKTSSISSLQIDWHSMQARVLSYMLPVAAAIWKSLGSKCDKDRPAGKYVCVRPKCEHEMKVRQPRPPPRRLSDRRPSSARSPFVCPLSARQHQISHKTRCWLALFWSRGPLTLARTVKPIWECLNVLSSLTYTWSLLQYRQFSSRFAHLR